MFVCVCVSLYSSYASFKYLPIALIYLGNIVQVITNVLRGWILHFSQLLCKIIWNIA